MEESVDAFTKARATALEFARNANRRSKSPKRKADDAEMETDAPTGSKRPRMSARLSSRAGPPPAHVEVVQDSNDEAEATESDEEDDYTPEISKFASCQSSSWLTNARQMTVSSLVQPAVSV